MRDERTEAINLASAPGDIRRALEDYLWRREQLRGARGAGRAVLKDLVVGYEIEPLGLTMDAGRPERTHRDFGPEAIPAEVPRREPSPGRLPRSHDADEPDIEDMRRGGQLQLTCEDDNDWDIQF
ncbi:MAG TPA: hypothetical protein VD862_00090 [Candidatus Paceibacterota bacterium]|nr:hypothetical protein [Candidatus Paceibacterota bacterium]